MNISLSIEKGFQCWKMILTLPTTWIANLQNYEKHIHIFWQLMKFYETCTHSFEKMVLTWESMIFLLKHDKVINGEFRGNYFYCVARQKENFIAYSFETGWILPTEVNIFRYNQCSYVDCNSSVCCRVYVLVYKLLLLFASYVVCNVGIFVEF